MSNSNTDDTNKLLDDQLSIALMVIGVTIVLMGLRQPLVLSTGVFLAASGALIAIRGGNASTLPRSARVWLWLAFATTVLGELGGWALDFFESWRASQLLEIGVSLPALRGALAPISVLSHAVKIGALVAAIAAVIVALRVLRDARRQPPPAPTSSAPK